MTTNPSQHSAAHTFHSKKSEEYARSAEEHLTGYNKLSWLRLSSFVSAMIFGIATYSSQLRSVWLIVSALSFLVFLGLGAWMLRIKEKRFQSEIRTSIHKRHLQRLGNEWFSFVSTENLYVTSDHPYAFDLDLVGKASLFQRIWIGHTLEGQKTLSNWLAQAATKEVIVGRQEAVQELSSNFEFIEELEAASLRESEDKALDASAFVSLLNTTPFLKNRPALTYLSYALPITTLSLAALSSFGYLATWLWILPLSVQFIIAITTHAASANTLDLVSSRREIAESYDKLLTLIENTSFTSPTLIALSSRIKNKKDGAAAQMRKLRNVLAFVELRTQPLLHLLFLNPLLLWDLHCLRKIEQWIEITKPTANSWFDAIGEVEALSSFAMLIRNDDNYCFPSIAGSSQGLQAKSLGHPLLSPAERVSNDLTLQGPGTVLIITGSNMAGKSTLLRAVGMNIALALSGGPVCAKEMKVPELRLRASIKVQDSLQAGASYFHAELSKLKTVVEDAEASPPIFFLLDELLRGTNTKARYEGARAVVMHLLARNATGIVATHDLALTTLESEIAGKATNAHFTDVVSDGVMTFDYKLRQGAVHGSNALRLLEMAGIDLPVEPPSSTPT